MQSLLQRVAVARDPRGNARRDKSAMTFVEVKTFYDPKVVILPNVAAAKPGLALDYRIAGTNNGNAVDAMSIQVALLDSNAAGSTLTTRGRVSGCPFRAALTAVPVAWTSAPVAGELLPAAPSTLDPGRSAERAFSIGVPRDWAGMDDTTYSFKVTSISQKDGNTPRVTKNFTGRQTVIQLVEAFVEALDGGGKALPPALFDDLHRRAAAMLLDMARARDSSVTSAS